MKTNVNFVLTELPDGTVKTVSMKTNDGNLKYNFLIRLLKAGVVVPSRLANEILLEALETHREDSEFLGHLIDYTAESSMVIEESEEIVDCLKSVVEELASLVDDDTAKEILEEYDLALNCGELVWIDEDGFENEIVRIDAEELLADHNLHFEEEDDEVVLVLG